MAGVAREAIVPEVLEPEAQIPADLRALRRFAVLMDEAVPIPGTRKRVGLDAALGLIPGVGDAIGGLLSLWVVMAALRHRVPLRRVTRMVLNILLDMVIGAIPLVGDVFDLFFEENMANVDLLIRYRDRTLPPRTAWSIGGKALVVVAIIALAGLVVLAAVVIAAIWLMRSRSVF